MVKEPSNTRGADGFTLHALCIQTRGRTAITGSHMMCVGVHADEFNEVSALCVPAWRLEGFGQFLQSGVLSREVGGGISKSLFLFVESFVKIDFWPPGGPGAHPECVSRSSGGLNQRLH